MGHRHVRLALLDKFTCTGSNCVASCCSYGWSIDVDAETYSKWQQADAEHSGLGLLASLAKRHDTNKYYLKQVANQCTHLSEQGLCRVQQELGHDYIPNTCQKYPRNSWSTGKFSAESLNLSCPEVLNLLLTEDDERLFEVNKKSKIKTTEHNEPTIPDEFSSLLDDYLSQVMRNRKYPVNILLLTITRKLIDIVLLSQQGNLGLSELQKQLNGASQQVKAMFNQLEQKQLSSIAADRGRFWWLVYSLGKMGNALPSALDKYQDALFEKIQGSDKSDSSFVEIGNDIQTYRQHFYQQQPGFFQDLMRKYLRIKFLNNAFPRSPVEGNLVAGLLYCLLPYAFIQLYTWVAASGKEVLTEQEVLEIIYSVERKLDHNEKIYQFLSEHPELLRLDTYYRCLADV